MGLNFYPHEHFIQANAGEEPVLQPYTQGMMFENPAADQRNNLAEEYWQSHRESYLGKLSSF